MLEIGAVCPRDLQQVLQPGAVHFASEADVARRDVRFEIERAAGS